MLLTGTGQAPRGSFHGVEASVAIAALGQASCLGGRLDELRGRTILIATREQQPAALALLELDGVARRMVLWPPDIAPEHFASVAANAGVDAFAGDDLVSAPTTLGVPICVTITSVPVPTNVDRAATEETEWILLTSGTTGVPKLVLHTLASLAGNLTRPHATGRGSVWSTLYDIRRYGGLQIFLRAVLGGGSLVLSSASEPAGEFLARAGRAGVTHISGTPTHWRRVLMSGAAQSMSPQYVRLSGEIADQPILDALRAAYPQASVAHAFASTEAGVAFHVDDGLAGFPASLIERADAEVEMKVEDDTLRIRSPRNAIRYLGPDVEEIARDDGFVDTGDVVELREGARYYFVGRRGGVINVGGEKVYPEEVEAVINAHPRVRMSLVRGRKSPITGAIVVADVVLTGGPGELPAKEVLRPEIIDTCRRALSKHKVPAMIRFVAALEVSASGKLVRPNA